MMREREEVMLRALICNGRRINQMTVSEEMCYSPPAIFYVATCQTFLGSAATAFRFGGYDAERISPGQCSASATLSQSTVSGPPMQSVVRSHDRLARLPLRAH